MNLAAAGAGFLLGAGLIIAIGAQNAFVLRQGLLRRHVFAICLFCALSDAALILAGVGGFGAIVMSSPLLLKAATWGGAAFLFAYGLFAFRRALTPSTLKAADGDGGSLGKALATAAAFTFLNPHVYLDTVVLVGGLSTAYGEAGRWSFGAGAATASFAWFFSLGYAARLLEGVFARPAAWRILDAGIGVVMWALAAKVIAAAP